MGSGGKKKGGFPVTRYYLSMFWGICASGRKIELLELKFGDKLVWRGSATAITEIPIDKPDLYGGDKKEGGVRGIATWLNGNPNQTLTGRIAAIFGKAPAELPGYRGVAGFFLSGVPIPVRRPIVDIYGNPVPILEVLSDLILQIFGRFDRDTGRGFYVCANNPYLKTISARVRRPSEGLNPSIAMIRLKDSSEGVAQYASNPAHIIFESMTNTDFGLGEPYSMFDVPSFEQCAQTLYDENFGINILWTRQSKIEDFIKIALDHIQGAVFVNPATGLHTMTLLRADYEIGDLPTVSPSNAKLSNFKTKIWGDISNEVTVTWTNPETGKEETVTVQDLAGMAAQGGGTTPASRNYHGIADQQLAFDVAERDLAAISYPLSSCEAEVTREFWKTVVQKCVILTWPRHGIESAIFRITKVANGSSSRTIKLSLIEDVFSLARAKYNAVVETEWTSPSTDPQPLSNFHLGTAPAFFTIPALGLSDISELEYPEVISAIAVSPDTVDDIGVEVVGYTTTPTGVLVTTTLGELPLSGVFFTQEDVPAEPVTVFDFSTGFLGGFPQLGEFLLIGSGSDEDTELANVTGINGPEFTVQRGMLDTTPKQWTTGTRIMVISPAMAGDTTPRSSFEAVDYHLRTITTSGTLPLLNTPKETLVLSERPHLPNRPRNVTVGGIAFGVFEMNNATSVLVEWANSNRLLEATQAPLWDDATAAPETGQTTTIEIMRASDRSLINVISGLTGTSHTLSRADFDGELDTIVKVTAVRDDLISLQGHEIAVTLNEDALLLEGDEAGNTLDLGDGTDFLLIEEV
jgi:hypothetical protein